MRPATKYHIMQIVGYPKLNKKYGLGRITSIDWRHDFKEWVYHLENGWCVVESKLMTEDEAITHNVIES